MAYLITPSLLNSFNYYMDSEEEWEDKARSDFWSSLKKIKTQPTESMQNGIDFENAVYAAAIDIESSRHKAEQSENRYDMCVSECAEYVTEGVFQPVVSKTIDINGVSFFLYGRPDVIKGPLAIDIKFTSNYEMGKYFKTAQGSCYLECLDGIDQFLYLVSDGVNVYPEVYRRTDLPKAEHLIREFWQTISAVPEMLDTYTSLWKARDE